MHHEGCLWLQEALAGRVLSGGRCRPLVAEAGWGSCQWRGLTTSPGWGQLCGSGGREQLVTPGLPPAVPRPLHRLGRAPCGCCAPGSGGTAGYCGRQDRWRGCRGTWAGSWEASRIPSGVTPSSSHVVRRLHPPRGHQADLRKAGGVDRAAGSHGAGGAEALGAMGLALGSVSIIPLGAAALGWSCQQSHGLGLPARPPAWRPGPCVTLPGWPGRQSGLRVSLAPSTKPQGGTRPCCLAQPSSVAEFGWGWGSRGQGGAEDR